MEYEELRNVNHLTPTNKFSSYGYQLTYSNTNSQLFSFCSRAKVVKITPNIQPLFTVCFQQLLSVLEHRLTHLKVMRFAMCAFLLALK